MDGSVATAVNLCIWSWCVCSFYSLFPDRSSWYLSPKFMYMVFKDVLQACHHNVGQI